MAKSKFDIGDLEVIALNLGDEDVKAHLGDTLLYPLSKPIDDAVVTCASATYNGSNQVAQDITVTLSGVTLVENTDYIVTQNTGGTNAGSYTVTVSGMGDYESTASGTFTINKVTPTVTAPTPLANVVYDGMAQVLINRGSTDYGLLMYSISGVVWSSGEPGATDAGDYTVYYKVVGDSNINDVAAQSIVATINKVTPTVVAPTPITNLVYNGNAQALINGGSTNWGTLQYSLDNSTYSTSIPSGTNATAYTVYYRVVGDSNINDVAAQNISVSISKVTPTVVAPTPKVLTYNGSAQELANAGSTDFGTLKYKVGSDSWSTSVPTRTRSGSYELYYKVDGDSNVYDVPSASTTCSINEKQVTATVTLSQTTYTYNGSACQPTPTVKDGTTVIDPSEYTVTYSNNINAGTATVTISDNVGGDYEVIGSATFTINKANSSLSFAVTNLTVEVGETKTNAVTVNAGDGNVTYSSNNTTAITVDNNGVVSGVGVGNATITANISSTNNYNSASTSYTASCALVLTAKYNVTSTSSPTKIASATTSFKSIEIDGATVSPRTGYTFSTTGEHTVKYYLNNTSIGNDAFSHCSGMTSVNIPSGVTTIGEWAFNYCYSLTSVTIPDSVTSVNNYAFGYCSGLTSCTIGSGVTSIGNGVFAYCNGLTSVDIPSRVTNIGGSAFSGCTSLTSIVIPSGVTYIGGSAFYGCSGLTSITVDATTPPTLGINAFSNTNNCRIIVPSCELVNTYSNTSGWSSYASRIVSAVDCGEITAKLNVTNTSNPTRIASGTSSFVSIEIDGVEQPSVTTGYTFSTTGEHTVKYKLNGASIGSRAFYGCRNLTNVDIPSGVTSIGNGAFYSATSLTSIDIPDSVISIGDSAFTWCNRMESIDIPSGVTLVQYATFSNCHSLTSVTIPSGVTSIGSAAFNCCSGLTSITLPDSVTIIGGSAFYCCSGLTSCTIGSGVTSIGDNAFNGCSGLTSVNIPSGVTSIGNSAFYHCTGLTSIDIPDSVTSIGNTAFTGCYSLTSINIPSGVTSIGRNAFGGCWNVSAMTVDSNNSYYDSRNNCNAIIETSTNTLINGCNNTVIPSSVTSIGNYAFYGYTGLTSIDIPSGVTSIGYDAFSGCRSLTSIDIPDSVTSIGDSAFYYCSGLTSIDIPSGVTSISNEAFECCYSLTSIDIPSGVTSIGNYAFSRCTGLTSIDIPSGVTTIGQYTFYYCSGLTRITVEATTPPTLGTYAFNETSNCQICVPTCALVDTYKAASGWSGYASRIVSAVACAELTAKFNVTDTTNQTRIVSATTSFASIEIDGVVQPSVTTGYTFSTTGEHTVKYGLNRLSIGTSAFAGCNSLSSIDIPSGVTSIGDYAFSRCTGLTSIDIPSGVTSISNYAFQYCSGLTSIDIPDSVTSIGNYTFQYCYGLTSCTIGSGVTSIGGSAFASCNSLSSIVSNAITAPTISSNTFLNIKTGGTLTVPIGSSGYDVWMGTGNYYLGRYSWTKVEQ